MAKMKSLMISVIIVFISQFCLSVKADEPVNLKELDRIVSQAKDLNDFLSDNPKSISIRDEYFKALQSYFGEEKMPRQAFDAIITQMSDVNKKVPGFGERLWQTTGLGQPFKIEVAVKTSGLELKQKEWSEKLAQWQSELKAKSDSYLNLSDKDAAGKLNTVLQSASKQVEEFNQKSQAMTRSARAEASKVLFEQTLPQIQGLEEAKAYLMFRNLKLEKNTDLLNSGDADWSCPEKMDTRSKRIYLVS
jgi:hypothetical protein